MRQGSRKCADTSHRVEYTSGRIDATIRIRQRTIENGENNDEVQWTPGTRRQRSPRIRVGSIAGHLADAPIHDACIRTKHVEDADNNRGKEDCSWHCATWILCL